MSLRRVNLNLLPVLRAMLQEKSVSRAAEVYGMSQSATSDALMQLRHVLGDPLLVRVGTRMELTAHAEALKPALDQICDLLEDFVTHKEFDPFTIERTFTISTVDYIIFLLAGTLIARLAVEAPNVSLKFVYENDELPDQLAARIVDLAIIPEFFAEQFLSSQIRFQPLFSDMTTALIRVGHPLSHLDRLSVEDLAKFKNLKYHSALSLFDRKYPNTLAGGHAFDTAADLTQLTPIPGMLINTDYFGLVPERLADWAASVLPLQVKKLTFVSEPIEIGLAWGPVQDADPAHIWLRGLIQECVNSQPAGLWSGSHTGAKNPK